MPLVADFVPLGRVYCAEGVEYELSIIREPISGREFSSVKRLITPQPVLALKVFSRQAGVAVDITTHVLAQFFVKASVCCGQTGAAEDQGLLFGVTAVSGCLYQIPCEDTSSTEGVFVFQFSDLGVIRRGLYRLMFDLYKYEGYGYLSCRPPVFSKIGLIVTARDMKIQGIREYYKHQAKTEYQRLVQRNYLEMQTDQQKLKVYRHLVGINMLKDDLKVAELLQKAELRPSLENLPRNAKRPTESAGNKRKKTKSDCSHAGSAADQSLDTLCAFSDARNLVCFDTSWFSGLDMELDPFTIETAPDLLENTPKPDFLTLIADLEPLDFYNDASARLSSTFELIKEDTYLNWNTF